MSNFTRFNSFQREAVDDMPLMAVRETTDQTNAAEPETTSSKATGESGSFQSHVRHVLTPQAALTVPAVYRAVGLIAKTEGQFMLQYQIIDEKGGNFVPEVGAVGSKYIT